MKEVFKSGDIVVAWIDNDIDAPPSAKDKGRGSKKEIVNESGVKIKVVLKQFWQKVYFAGEMLHAIDFNKWSKKIEVYWYTYFSS